MDIELTAAERELLDDRDRREGYLVQGPGGTDGNTPTIFEAVEQILAERAGGDLRRVWRICWDGEISMSGQPHVQSIGTEFTSRADAERGIEVLSRPNIKPNLRIQTRLVSEWEDQR